MLRKPFSCHSTFEMSKIKRLHSRNPNGSDRVKWKPENEPFKNITGNPASKAKQRTKSKVPGNQSGCDNSCRGYKFSSVHFSSVQSFSCVWLFETPWISAHQASLSITNSRSLNKLMSIESVVLSIQYLIFPIYGTYL